MAPSLYNFAALIQNNGKRFLARSLHIIVTHQVYSHAVQRANLTTCLVVARCGLHFQKKLLTLGFQCSAMACAAALVFPGFVKGVV